MEFTLHQPFVMSSKNAVSVNYPEARLDNPIELDSWQMLSQNICTPYFLTPNFLTSSLAKHAKAIRTFLFFILFSFVEDETERNIAINFGMYLKPSDCS